MDDTREIISVLRRRFPKLVTRSDICYATTNRQAAVKALAKKVDLVLAIGAENSSNCNRLREVAEAQGVPAYLINGPNEVNPSWLDGVSKVGITSGASTPEALVDAVITRLQPEDVTTFEVVTEDVTFVLPKKLRTPQKRASAVKS